jgi:hypothetical protein
MMHRLLQDRRREVIVEPDIEVVYFIPRHSQKRVRAAMCGDEYARALLERK